MPIGLGLAQASHEVHHPRVFVVCLPGVVGFDGFELRDVLGINEAGLVSEATSAVQKFALASSGRFGQDEKAVQADLLGEAFQAT